MEAIVVILIVVAIVLMIVLVNFKTRTAELRLQLDLALSEHRNKVSELEKNIVNRAKEQFDIWRNTEMQNIKAEQLALATREAKTLLKKWKIEEEAVLRDDAIRRSQSVIIGKAIEHLIPYLPKFKYNPKDVRFFGDPIDLIVFDGLNEGFIREIVFVEVKTGSSSRLSRKQQDIRDAIRSRPISWVSMRVKTDESAKPSPIEIDDQVKSLLRPEKVSRDKQSGRLFK